MSYPTPSKRFRFGLFEADLENALLARKGVRIRLQEQPFRILAMLLERAGQIVTREELQKTLWPTGTYVDFDGSLNAALKRLRAALDDDADNPRFIETVPKRGYRFIAPVTVEESPAEDRAEKWVSAALPSADAEQIPTDPNPALLNSWSPERFAFLGALTFLLVLSVFFVIRKRFATPRTQLVQASASVDQARSSIAVLGFHNASGRSSDAWLSTALTEMLRTELGAGDKLRVVSGEQVEQFRLLSPWSGTDSLSPQTTARIGNALGGDLLVLGSYTTLGGSRQGNLRVDFRLQNARTGEIVYEGEETGTEQQFFALATEVGVALREHLGLPDVTESEEVGVLSSLPSDPDADRFYALGLQKMREYDYATAKDLFLQAETISPDFPLTHLMLSRSWGALGYDQKSRVEAEKAFKLSASLPETDKLLVEGAYFQTLKNLDRAAAAYRALYTLYPDSVDYAEQLIVVLNAAGRREEALAIIKQLRTLPPPASEDPRIDFWQGELISYSKGSAAQPFLEKAAAEAASRGQKLLYARFRLNQCINLVYGDHPEGAVAHCQEAYDIFIAAGNRLYAADALRTIGDRRGAKGDIAGARDFYHRALAILTPLGEHEKTGVVLNNMAITYENQGQIDQAEKLFLQAAETWRECGDTLNAGVALGNLADISMVHGELHLAETHYERARKQIEVTDPLAVAYDLYSIAAVRLYEGDIAGAKDLASRALAMAQQRDSLPDVAQAATTVGDILMAHGDLPGARENYQEALAIRQQLGNKGGVAENQAALAAVSIEEGNLVDAEPALRKALAEFRAEKAFLNEVPAEVDLSRILLREGKLAEGRQIISDAVELSATTRDPALKLPVAIQDARIEAAEISSRAKSKPDLSDPRRKLQIVLSAARQLGYYGIECDARLALGELELHVAPSVGRSDLRTLAEEAHRHGMDLVSRQAAALLQPPASSAKLASASTPRAK